VEEADETWKDRALCKGAPITMFFLTRGEDPKPAQALCQECPVRIECIEYALATDCYEGIFGGLTHRGRVKFVRARMTARQAVA
jgi:WhiB family redox-sensing transcriptional regulator